ncbi:hypothetical protein ED733_002738 [Metarhizium rileyi]|uniref:Uncharacterized protein n=1 Tax=Metarhizium rileyi (strain RCEF 4871) TaxID=1649241 RepID=A0A5C6FZG4_METRR|nr:hypothetical protein ED733_002738 [Metarhizium rileyi]
MGEILKNIALRGANKIAATAGYGDQWRFGYLFATSSYEMSEENGKEWAKNLATTAIGSLPQGFGAIAGIVGFLNLMKTTVIAIDKATFPELYAKKEMDETCFTKNGRTYSDLCNNCKPHLYLSMLGRINDCSKETVVRRDANVDRNRVIGFCSGVVLCDGYDGGGTHKIISQASRYDPVQRFWCMSREERMGVLLNDQIGETFRSNILEFDTEKLRKALEPVCKEVMGGTVENQCPTRDELKAAEKEYPPIEFCMPGKSRAEQKMDEAKYEQDPTDPDLFAVAETNMQYRREEGGYGVWTGQCGHYRDSSDGQLNHGCCGPFEYETRSYSWAKPEDGQGWCHIAGDEHKVPEELRRIEME